MDRISRFGLWAGLQVTCMSLLFSHVGLAKKPSTVKVCSGEWAPLTGKGIKDQGFFTKIVKEVFAKMEIPVEIDWRGWGACEKLTEKGKFFATFPYYSTPERRKRFAFSNDIVMSTTYFYTTRKYAPITWSSLDDLKTDKQGKQRKFGGLKGYFYVESFKDKGLKVDYSHDLKEAVSKLLGDRYQLFPENELVMAQYLKEQESKRAAEIVQVPNALRSEPLHLMISNKYPNADAIRAHFNKALAILQSEKSLEDYKKPYL